MQESFRQETGPYRKRRKMHSTDVFISHAGLDKLLIARPIWEKLQAHGLNCFLDSMSLQPGYDGPDELAKAMESAKVGVFILSPEFAARKWTMMELRCFLRRRSEAIGSGMRPPILFPVFYRLSIRECRELDPDRYWDGEGNNIFEVEKFFSEERQREASTATVKRELQELADIPGVENDEEATNLLKDEFSHLARAHFVERVFRSVKNKLEKDSSDEVRDAVDAIGDVMTRLHVHSLVLSAIPKSYDTLTHTFPDIPHRHKNAQIFSTDVGAVNVKYFTTNRIEAMNRQGIDIVEYLRNAILRVLENNFHNDRVLMSNILNNISVMYFNELQASSSIPQLRKMGRELLEQAIGISKECDKARANLALLLWRGHDRTGDEAEISRVIKLLEEAISIRPLPKHRVLLARVLISADSGLLCDWDRAKELLYDAIREDLFGPAEELLADMLTHEREGVPPDVSGANRLRSLPLYSRVNSKEKADTLQRVGFQDSQEYVETKLKEAKAKQSQIFLLVLGGGARGKTSLVRSLRKMSFETEYNRTELAALSRIQVLLGSREMSEVDVDMDELAHHQDSLNAILSRQAISSPNTVIRKPTTVENRNQNPAPSIPYAHSKGEHATINDERTPRRTTSFINLAPQTGNTSQPPKVTMNPLLARLRNDLENSATPKEIDGTLVQCWDLAGQSQYVMAHALFVKNGSLFVFVVNLKNLLNISTRVEEVRELCRWMQLVHALVPNSKFVQPIIVGTHKDCCRDLEEAEDVLLKGLKDEVGTAVYNDWVRARPKAENDIGSTISFIAVENRTALEDPGESGIEELEELIKRMSDDIVASRLEVPLRWIAFVEEVERKSAEMNAERMSTVVWNIQEIFKCVDGFPAFSTKKEERYEEALQALKYFSKLGRVVLFEISEKELYLFPRPVAMLDFVRRVTGPEECARRRLSQEHARLLDKGLLTKEGLKELWHEHSQETCEVMLQVLCRVDLLIQVQPANNSKELFAIPALLPKAGKWLQCRRASEESELRLVTEFVDAFPPGLMGSLISRLHKGVGRACPKVGKLASDAAILTLRLQLKETGRVMVSFVSQKRHIEWKVFAQDPVSVAKRCLIDVEEFSSMPLRGKPFLMKHYLRTQCRSDLTGCGGEWTASFQLPGDWVKSVTEKGLRNLDGECTDCEEAWRLWQLMPEMEKYHGPARPEALRALTVIQRSSKEVGMKAVDVFISHAGPDKWTIASPLFGKFRGEGFSCFFDKKSMKAGDCASEEMIPAMGSAKIGVFILSPEFAARRWPMKELRCFLRRRRDAQSSGATLPILIPVFYRLGVSECRSFKPEQYMDENGSNLFEAEKFYTEERQKEATMAMVKDELVEITKTTGIENEEAASNDLHDPLAFGFRKMLVERIVYSVKKTCEARQQQEVKGVGIPSTSAAANR